MARHPRYWRRVIPLIRSCISARGRDRNVSMNPFANKDLRVVADDCWQPTSNTFVPMDKIFGSTSTKLLISETPFGYYIQPTVPHYKFQFEDFFGFGPGNMGFHKGRTIFIPK